MECFRCPAGHIRNYNQLSAIQERAPEFPNRKVEGVRMEQCPYIFSVKVEPGFGSRKKSNDVAVGYEHAFRLTRRARCVDDVSDIILDHFTLEVLFFFGLQFLQLCGGIETDYFGSGVRK